MDKIYLRPSADISVGHELYPAESTSAYSLINEEVVDTTTYISVTAPVATDANTPSTATASSSFMLSGVLPTEKFRISSGKIASNTIGTSSGSTYFVIDVNGVSYTTYTYTMNGAETKYFDIPDEVINTINNYIINNGTGSFPNISIALTTTVTTLPQK